MTPSNQPSTEHDEPSQPLDAALAERDALRRELAAIQSSLAWRIALRITRAGQMLFPAGTRRERLARLAFKGLRVWRAEGLRALLRQTGRWARQAPARHPASTSTIPSHTASGLPSAAARLRQAVPPNWSILFVSHDAHRGGAQAVLLNTVAWFHAHTTVGIKILCLDGGELLPQFQQLADTLVPNQKSKDNAALAAQVLDFCGGEPPTLIFGNTVVAGAAYPWLAALGAPILTHVHELEDSIRHYGKDAMPHVLRHSSHFLACSAVVAGNLARSHGVAPEKVSIGHAAIFESQPAAPMDEAERCLAKQRLGLPQHRRLVFACGIGMPFRKGADLFIELGRTLRQLGRDDFHLCWIGGFDGAAHDLRHGVWADQLDRMERDGLGGHVTFLGLQSNPKEFFALGDLHVMTSREEPFGLVALEAADCGLPTVCFSDIGAADFVGADAGCTVPPGDVAAMAREVARLLDDAPLRAALGAGAKAKFHDGYTVARTAPHILSACRRVAGKAPAVSVIVPNYNHAPYLVERLDTVFGQSFQDVEVILLDDASTDGSVEVLRRYGGRADVRIVQNTENTGSPFVQWLKGFALAQADVWWIAESDDVSDPEFLRTLLPAFQHQPVKLAYANSHVIDERSVVQGDYLGSDYLTELSHTRWGASYRMPAVQEINEAMGIKDTILNISAVLFRRIDLAPLARATLEGMRMAGDWFFIVQAIKGGEVWYEAAKLNSHRRHTESVIGKLLASKRVENFYREMALVHHAVLENYPLEAGFGAKWERYQRGQWQQFFPGRPFAELNGYYPFDALQSAIASAEAKGADSIGE